MRVASNKDMWKKKREMIIFHNIMRKLATPIITRRLNGKARKSFNHDNHREHLIKNVISAKISFLSNAS